MSRRRKTISVVIPTYNCSDDLHKCLESVSWADEIIVVDMGSTDNTVKVAQEHRATVYMNIPKDGNFDQNRKIAMKKSKGDWILKLDSDESLTPELQQEIQRLLVNDDASINGYNLYNKTFMFGHEVRHGFIKPGSHELRLVRNGVWHYNPYRFHQLITVNGKTNFLNHYYLHNNARTISNFINKMNLYTDLDANHAGKKISILRVILAPIRTFNKLFFFQSGYLDGRVGFITSSLFAIYNLVEKIKIWDLQSS